MRNLLQSILLMSSPGPVLALCSVVEIHVSMGRWSDRWSTSLTIWHFRSLSSIAWLPQIRSTVVSAFGYVNHSGGEEEG